MGFSMDVGVPVVTVFLQGLLSFFSPCVLPLVPLYLGYLSGGAEQGELYGKRGRLFVNTICFVIGISSAFFMMGLGVSAAGSFLNKNQAMVSRIGGILVILFGLYQLGIFGKSKLLGTEHRFWLKLDKLKMSPVVALVFGFTFSFAWTPCVGPALASVLLMAGSAGTKLTGFLLIGVYTLGFILPFLAVGLFTAKVLGFFKKYNYVVKYTVKIGGILMIFMGLLMFTGKMNAITGYLSGTAGTQTSSKETTKKEIKEEKQDTYPATDFVLQDQYGKEHSLADYKGKTIFLNFWATWCGPCRNEMPEIQKIYEDICEMVSGQPLRKIIIGSHVKFSDGKWRKKSRKRYIWSYMLKAPVVPGDILMVNTKTGKAFICVNKIEYAAGKFCSKYKKVRKHLNIRMEEEDTNYEK